MDKIKDFFENITFEKLLNLFTKWYVVMFLIMFIILITILILTCIFIRTKKLRQIVTYEDNNVRYFSIHFDKNYVYSVDKRNLSKKRKENLEWFYNCFSPGEKVRLQVWLNELVKVDHTAPNHLEVTTKVKNVKQPIFTVIDVTHINYEDKIIHLESRLFPTIKKNKRRKNSKTNIVYYTEMPKILLDYEDNPRTLFLIRLSSLDTVEKENTDFDFTLFTLLISRLVKFLSPSRYLCQLKSNEIVIVDFKMRTKNEAIALGHSFAKVIQKTLGLSSTDDSISYRIGINQEKKQESDFTTLTRFAREVAIYAETNNLSTDVLIYDHDSIKHQENVSQIITNIKRNIDRRLFTCRYTPILNTKDGTVFGYDCLLSAPKSVVYSITSMLEYASHNNFLVDLLRVLYLETNSGYTFSSSRAYSTQFVTMSIKLSYYEEIIEIFTRIERPKNVNTIFILNDKDIDDIDVNETTKILRKLKHHNLTIGLEITSTSLVLLPEILKLFDYFIINGTSFSNVSNSQPLILFSDMISRLGSYKGTIIATEVHNWTLIELFINLNIKHISSPLFGQRDKTLPLIEYRKVNKLVNIYNQTK
ncbi:MAG: hypothetical protein E7177_04460 [Erysipelotrichaceae bacterium]|nr:hypothetical protein [Erysipelotrichaceae bacterium]